MKSGSSDQLPRRVFMASLVVLVLGATFLYGVLAQRNDLPPVPQLWTAYETLTTIDDNEVTNHPRRHHLQPSRDEGSGVTVDEAPDDGALILMAGFFDDENQIRIVERDGTVVRKWSLDYLEHFPDPEARVCNFDSPLGVDTHGVQATPEGDVIFNYEYCGTVKLDQCGNLAWSVNEPTHHSLVPAEAGGYWAVGRDQWRVDEDPDRYPAVVHSETDQTIQEDTILRIGEDGEVLDEISIPLLMQESGLEAMLTANGTGVRWTEVHGAELVHANKVTELPSEIADAYPMFDAGDLAISMRTRNLVMVVDPEAREVKWHQTGPWLRQHDPEFRPDGRLSIFNNNVYGTAYVDGRTDLDTPFTTNIMTVDPVSGETTVTYGDEPGQEMLSVIRGKHQLLEDGGMLIAEFDAGRVLEVAADGQTIWEYVNEYDDDFVGEVTDALVYPADYFQTEWPTCEQ